MDSSKKKKKIMIATVAGLLTALIIYAAINALSQQILTQNNTIAGLQQQIAKFGQNGSAQTTGTNAVVAKVNIPQGTTLSADMVVLKPIAYDKPDAVTDIQSVVGKRLKTNIRAGQIMQDDFLVDSNNITYAIPAGYRAITIPVECMQGLASYIKVGAFVDIISTGKSNNAKPYIVIENVKILSFETTDTKVEKTDAKTAPAATIQAITFKIPAVKATPLVDAMINGKLQVVMRGYNDVSSVAQYMPKQSKAVVKKVKHSKMASFAGMSLPSIPTNVLGIPNFSSKSNPGLPSADIPKQRKYQPVEFIKASTKTEVNFDE